jgi:large subunit ribosomal protein L35
LRPKFFFMPKMKTHSSAKKRFTLTGSGKVKRFQAGARHLLRKKSNKAKTRLLGSALVSVADQAKIKRLLCP